MFCDSGYAAKAFGRACRVLGATGKVTLDESLPGLPGALGYAIPDEKRVWLKNYASYTTALHEVLHVLFPNASHESIYKWSGDIAYGRGSARIVAEARERSREL